MDFLLPNFSISFQNMWLLPLLVLVSSTVMVLLIPRYNLSRFINQPKLRYSTLINKTFYWFLMLLPVFLPYSSNKIFLYIGLAIFLLGFIAYSLSIFYFAISEYDKVVTSGIYRISRHPVYLSFFIIFLGISISSNSIILFIFNVFYFINSILIMKEEEKACIEQYGNEYLNYMKKVRRIF